MLGRATEKRLPFATSLLYYIFILMQLLGRCLPLPLLGVIGCSTGLFFPLIAWRHRWTSFLQDPSLIFSHFPAKNPKRRTPKRSNKTLSLLLLAVDIDTSLYCTRASFFFQSTAVCWQTSLSSALPSYFLQCTVTSESSPTQQSSKSSEATPLEPSHEY